ncbi:hypothetical protein NQ315_002654 [Exocentrus adspersus]|uniref:Uncharacterized protein n=1 Tax=Exocentrus adspersus TaxID=1586481 RepID=A0AAV8VUV0_9CUCU|nr:hypothetical protein NQ315_002654 [Exocentrus adspersus]
MEAELSLSVGSGKLSFLTHPNLELHILTYCFTNPDVPLSVNWEGQSEINTNGAQWKQYNIRGEKEEKEFKKNRRGKRGSRMTGEAKSSQSASYELMNDLTILQVFRTSDFCELVWMASHYVLPSVRNLGKVSGWRMILFIALFIMSFLSEEVRQGLEKVNQRRNKEQEGEEAANILRT